MSEKSCENCRLRNMPCHGDVLRERGECKLFEHRNEYYEPKDKAIKSCEIRAEVSYNLVSGKASIEYIYDGKCTGNNFTRDIAEEICRRINRRD